MKAGIQHVSPTEEFADNMWDKGINCFFFFPAFLIALICFFIHSDCNQSIFCVPYYQSIHPFDEKRRMGKNHKHFLCSWLGSINQQISICGIKTWSSWVHKGKKFNCKKKKKFSKKKIRLLLLNWPEQVSLPIVSILVGLKLIL